MNRIGEGTYGIVCESQILINISHINSNIMYQYIRNPLSINRIIIKQLCCLTTLLKKTIDTITDFIMVLLVIMGLVLVLMETLM